MKNLKSKILIAMLSLMVLTLASLLVVFRWYVGNTNTQTLSESMLSLSAQAASNFDYIIKDCVSDIEGTAGSYDYTSKSYDKDRLDMLNSEYMSNPYINSFAMFKASGSMSAHNDGLCSALVTKEDIEKCVRRESTVVTDVRENENSRFFFVLVPLIKGGSVESVTAAAVNCNLVNNKLSELTRMDSTELFIVDDSGKVLFSSGHGHVEVGSVPAQMAGSDSSVSGLADAVNTALSGRSGSYEYNTEDTDYSMAYKDTSYFDSVLIATTDKGTFNGSYGTKEFTMIGITIILLFIITLIYANYFSSRISHPIGLTTERLRLLANGDTTSSVDVWTSKDELGVLSNSLGETVSCLRLYIMLIKQALQQIADGNLTYRMDNDFKGDFASIKDSFNDIFDQLCATFDSINHSAQQVTSGAVQVANSAHSLSQGATQQASAIEELSATLTNVADQVVQNSDNARNAYKIVDDNSHAIEDCNADMEKLLDAMQLISRTADEITEILKAIDEISFQTNILALNAAVEAAREGSKGFGVVADEVRRLAARTAEAAKQTSSLIDKTADAVTRGHSIAVKTADSLREVEEGSAQICLLMRNIADASAEQSDAIMQINTGVDQISDVVSANTAAAIGSASASEELSGQSLILKNMIAKFRLTNASETEEEVNSEPDMDYNFSIDTETPVPAPRVTPSAKAPAPAPAPLPRIPEDDVLREMRRPAAPERPAPRAQSDRGSVGDIFMKRDNKVFVDRDDDDDDDYEIPAPKPENAPASSTKQFNRGDVDIEKANKMLADLFSKRDSAGDDDDDDDDEAPGNKPGIGALFKTDVDDDDDKY